MRAAQHPRSRRATSTEAERGDDDDDGTESVIRERSTTVLYGTGKQNKNQGVNNDQDHGTRRKEGRVNTCYFNNTYEAS